MLKKKTFPRLFFWQLLLLFENLSFNRKIFLFLCENISFLFKNVSFLYLNYLPDYLAHNFSWNSDREFCQWGLSCKLPNYLLFHHITHFPVKHHITSKSRTTQIQKYQVNTFEIQYKYPSNTKNFISNTTQIHQWYQTNTFGIQYKYIRNTKQIQNRYTDNVE